MMAKILYRLDIMAPEMFYDQILGLLCQAATFGWEEKSLCSGETVFRIHCANYGYLAALRNDAALISSKISFQETEFEESPWQDAWKEFFTPVYCGKQFVILPPWLAEEDFGQRKKIIIEPECAFGTGHHASTVLCLGALDALGKRDVNKANFLDLGCGSGVLGIGAALLGMRGVCVDTDELAVKNAKKNVRINGLEDVEILEGSVDSVKHRQFDLVMANILAKPLMEMAQDIVGCLAANGALILSGILDIQADAVENVYLAFGLPKAKRIADGEWRALVWDLQ